MQGEDKAIARLSECSSGANDEMVTEMADGAGLAS